MAAPSNSPALVRPAKPSPRRPLLLTMRFVSRKSMLTLSPTLTCPPFVPSFSRPRPGRVRRVVHVPDALLTRHGPGMTFEEIGKAIDHDEVWVAAAFYGQVRLHHRHPRPVC